MQIIQRDGAINIYANCQNVNIVNCNLDTCGEGIHISHYGEYLTSPKHVNISNCNFKNCKSHAVYMEGITEDLVEFVNIVNCSVYNITTQDGFGIRKAKNINVQNNIFNIIKRNAIDVRDGVLVNINSNIIKNSTLGIMTGYSTTTADRVYIRNNIIDTDVDYTGTHSQGIYVRGTSSNCVVENNTINNCTSFYLNITGSGHTVRNQSINNDNATTVAGSLLYGTTTPSSRNI